MDWINIFGLIVVVLLLVPNILYAYNNRNIVNKCTNRAMNIIEQTGRYGSMFLMTFNIGLAEFESSSGQTFAIWLISMCILMLLYWVFWFLYSKAEKLYSAIMLAVVPSIIFALSGILLRHWLLVMFSVIFAVGHIYVTYKNNAAK